MVERKLYQVYTALNVMKLTRVLQIYHKIFHIENGVHRTNSSRTKTHKRIPIHHGQWVKNFKSLFQYVYIILNPNGRKFCSCLRHVLKFRNLSAKFASNFNDYIIHQIRKFSSFYLKHSNHDALSLTLLIFFGVTIFFIISLLVAFLK